MMAQTNLVLKWSNKDLLEGTTVPLGDQVSNSNLVCQVNKFPEGQKEVNISNVFTTMPFSSGKNYWAMKVMGR